MEKAGRGREKTLVVLERQSSMEPVAAATSEACRLDARARIRSQIRPTAGGAWVRLDRLQREFWLSIDVSSFPAGIHVSVGG